MTNARLRGFGKPYTAKEKEKLIPQVFGPLAEKTGKSLDYFMSKSPNEIHKELGFSDELVIDIDYFPIVSEAEIEHRRENLQKDIWPKE